MSHLLNSYKLVVSNLATYKNRCRHIQQLLDQEHEQNQSEQKHIQDAFSESIESLNNTITRVTAFMSMAKMNAAYAQPSYEPHALDLGLLSRLAVQIDSFSANDSFAQRLYTEASAQLLFLQKQKAVLDADKQRKERTASDSLGHSIEKLRQQQRSLFEEIRQYLRSVEFSDFIDNLSAAFEHQGNSFGEKGEKIIQLGKTVMPFPVPDGVEEDLRRFSHNLCNTAKETIVLPAEISYYPGSVLIADYDYSTESVMLGGVQNLALTFIRRNNFAASSIFFVDPVRMNCSSMGCLRDACNNGVFFDPIPSTKADLQSCIHNLVLESTYQSQQRKQHTKKSKLCVFLDFPNSYESRSIAYIRQLCVNAKEYGLLILLAHNIAHSNYSDREIFAHLMSFADRVFEKNGELFFSGQPFAWHNAPRSLPTDIAQSIKSAEVSIDLSNEYEKRIGFDPKVVVEKGIRRIKSIPYGVDENGTIQCLDFEDSNFATFLCGAARSGKSTLLHALISSIIARNHPDDIELWLIDFKMTEFSRYISHLPPHVRYIVLDESPELVYDLIDKLTENLIRRQDIFKGKWLKLQEVPVEKYMPAIFVIIDEFSVMSQILADSVLSSGDNYILKLQTLLAKGSALGIHFIFSSQGFTSGTRGLNDFSKKQIQQRIAMKTEYAEIKDTLDLRTTSDKDKSLMEQLEVHHALVRIPVDAFGNHLKLSHVLYISDYRNQEQYIDQISHLYARSNKYFPNDPSKYVYKHTLIKDGNQFYSFSSRTDAMQKMLTAEATGFREAGRTALFLGDPRRLQEVFPVYLFNEFCQNMLMFAPYSEIDAGSSVIMSVEESLKMQGVQVEFWTTWSNNLFQKIEENRRKRIKAVDVEEVCERIREVKEAVQRKRIQQRFFVLLGFETMLLDMRFQTDGAQKQTEIEPEYAPRGEGEPDLLTQISSGSPVLSQHTDQQEAAALALETRVYDAREDLVFILTNGPRYGYHFLMAFGTPGEFSQVKLDASLFKHKIMFRMSRADGFGIVSSSTSAIVSELENHSFRYSDGLSGLSFRPYLHEGLSWNGWHIEDGSAVCTPDDEENYFI